MDGASLESVYKAFSRNRRSRGRSWRTLEVYSLSVRAFDRFLMRELQCDDLTQVSRELLEDFLIDYMEVGGHSKASTSKVFRSLRAIFNWAHNQDMIATNPIKKVGAPEVRSEPRDGYTNTEVKAIVSAMRAEFGRPGWEGFVAVRDHALSLVLYDTGLRATEVCNMTVEGLDLDTGLFDVKGKGAKTYRRHLGAVAIKAIQQYLDMRENRMGSPTGPLWRGKGGYPLTRSGLFRMCQSRAAAVDVENGGVHKWRYTHAEVLEEMDWPEDLVMAEMGHSVLSVSRSYREKAIRRRALSRHAEQSPADKL